MIVIKNKQIEVIDLDFLKRKYNSLVELRI